MGTNDRKNIVIIGGGVVGCCCAYYITRHPAYDRAKHSVTILEATRIAGGSSGKAGGLLQTNAEPACIAPLSFKLHADLASQHDGRKVWGYRNVHVGECDLVGRSSPETVTAQHPSISVGGKVVYPDALDWVLPTSIQSYENVGTPADSAQVHPYLFTASIARLAEEKDVTIIRGTATVINYVRGGTRISSVSYREHNHSDICVLPATDLIVAAGPWTSSIFPSASIGGAKSHSIVIRPSKHISDNCLWASISPGPAGMPESAINLELYSRPDNTLYSCEWADPDAALPARSDQVEVDERRLKTMRDALASISDELRDGEVITKQACYQPVVLKNGRRAKNAGPLLGPTGVECVLLACGHDSWGVQNAPATGLIISEMIFEGSARSADVRSLDPRLILQQPMLA